MSGFWKSAIRCGVRDENGISGRSASRISNRPVDRWKARRSLRGRKGDRSLPADDAANPALRKRRAGFVKYAIHRRNKTSAVCANEGGKACQALYLKAGTQRKRQILFSASFHPHPIMLIRINLINDIDMKYTLEIYFNCMLGRKKHPVHALNKCLGMGISPERSIVICYPNWISQNF